MTTYRLRSGTRYATTGPLALVAVQAATAARLGRQVEITGPDGDTYAIATDPTGGAALAVVEVGPLDLFTPINETRSPWATRLADLINQERQTP